MRITPPTLVLIAALAQCACGTADTDTASVEDGPSGGAAESGGRASADGGSPEASPGDATPDGPLDAALPLCRLPATVRLEESADNGPQAFYVWFDYDGRGGCKLSGGVAPTGRELLLFDGGGGADYGIRVVRPGFTWLNPGSVVPQTELAVTVGSDASASLIVTVRFEEPVDSLSPSVTVSSVV